MKYDIEWKPRPQKFLSNLQKDIALRIWKKIGKLKENPFRYLKHHEGRDVYKLRIGDYRALIDVDAKNRVLIIEVLDKRPRIYKR